MGRFAARRARKARLIVLSEFVDPVQTSTGYYWAKLIGGLAREFGGISVICPESSYRRITAPAPDVEYHPFRDHVFDKNKLVSRMFGQLLQTAQFSAKLISLARRGDVVFSGTNPPFSPLIMPMIKNLTGCRWLLLVHDVFPENLVAANVVRRGGILYAALKLIYDRAYACADLLVAIGRDMAELLAQKTRRAQRVVYIPNWVDLEEVQPRTRDLSRFTRGWDDKVVFQFFGNLGRVQGLRNLLDAVARVKSPRAAFLFIGAGSGERLIEGFVSEHPELSIALAGSLPFSDNNAGLSACDVAIVSLASGMKGLAVPSKAYFSLAADKPLLVVADRDSELHRLLQEEPSTGWYCEPDDPVALGLLIDWICAERLGDLRGVPRAVAARRFSYADSIEHYCSCIRRLGLSPIASRASNARASMRVP